MSRRGWRTVIAGVALVTLFVALFGVAAQAREGRWKHGRQKAIGTLEVFVNAADHQVAEGKIRVFVPSKAPGTPCLATINNTNHLTAGTTLVCGNPDERDGVPGVTITLLTPSAMPADAWWHIVLHQDKGAIDREGDQILPVVFP